MPLPHLAPHIDADAALRLILGRKQRLIMPAAPTTIVFSCRRCTDHIQITMVN